MIFTQREIIEIFVSIIALSVFFYFYFPKFSFFAIVILVTFSFIAHELGHKFTAMLFGCRSEYHVSYFSLILGLIIGFLTNWKIIFAAPGYVESYKSGITQNEKSLISFAGPLFNFLIAFICIYLISKLSYTSFLKTLATFNVIMGIFNLLPFPGFDGYEVYRWNRVVWFLAIMIGILILLILVK